MLTKLNSEKADKNNSNNDSKKIERSCLFKSNSSLVSNHQFKVISPKLDNFRESNNRLSLIRNSLGPKTLSSFKISKHSSYSHSIESTYRPNSLNENAKLLIRNKSRCLSENGNLRNKTKTIINCNAKEYSRRYREKERNIENEKDVKLMKQTELNNRLTKKVQLLKNIIDLLNFICSLNTNAE